MPKIVRLEGKTYSVPDDASLDEIDALIGGGPAASTSPAGTIEYKRETARQQLEANRPVPTAATGLQNLGEGIVDSLSGMIHKPQLDLMNPEVRKRSLQPGLGETLSGMYHGVVDPVVNYGKHLMAGDPDAAAREGGKILTQTVPGVEGAASLIKKVPVPEALNLQELANKARDYRAAHPVMGSPATKVGMIHGAIRAVPNAATGVAGYTLEKLARLRNAMDSPPGGPGLEGPLPEHTGSYPLEDNQMRQDVGGAPRDVARTDVPSAPPPVGAPGRSAGASEFEPFQPPAPVQLQGSTNPYPTNPYAEELARMRSETEMANTPDLEYQPSVREPLSIEMPNAPDLAPSIPSGPVVPNTPEFFQMKAGLSPRGRAANIRANENIPYLAEEIPALRNTPPGKAFDQMLFDGFKRAESKLIAEEQSIPRDRQVSTKEMVDGLSKLEEQSAAALDDKAVRVIAKAKDDLVELGGSVPWEQFIKIKRAFFDHVRISSVPGRAAYQMFKKASADVSEALAKANQSYYTTRVGMEAADMSLKHPMRNMAKTVAPEAPPTKPITPSRSKGFRTPL